MALFSMPIHLPNVSTLALKSVANIPHPHPCFTVSNTNETLVDVSLTRLYLKSISLPWRCITHLEMRRSFKDESLAILSQTPNLMHFILQDVPTGNDGHPQPNGLIHLDNLETFDCYSRVGFAMDGMNFLEYLRAPKLRTIRVVRSPFPFKFAEQLVELSQTTLTLIIIGWEGASEGLLEIWGRHPGLCVVALGSSFHQPPSRRPRLSTVNVDQTYGPGKTDWENVSCYLPALELELDT